MKQEKEVLYAEYVIDGVRMESSPAEILADCMPRLLTAEMPEVSEIADESLDPAPGKVTFAMENISEYIDAIRAAEAPVRPFECAFAETFTKQRIALSLLDTIWKDGHFRLQDLCLDLSWDWDSAPLGNMAAFYDCCESASEFIYGLGVGIGSLKYTPAEGKAEFRCACAIDNDAEDGRSVGSSRKCPDKELSGAGFTLMFIPFDTCQYRLGGSLLSRISGSNGDIAPEFGDPDYFLDCYEVVRELVEDGIIVSGVTVGDGGLIAAADRFRAVRSDKISLDGLAAAYSEKDRTRLLFGEIPGVLVQIKTSDIDYFDSQMLLQDIAYFKMDGGSKPAIGNILASLLDQASEGED